MNCRVWSVCCCWLLLFAVSGCGTETAAEQPATQEKPATPSVRTFVQEFCVECHNTEARRGGLDLDALGTADIAKHADVWEKVVRKLRTREMPPARSSRPDERAYEATLTSLTTVLDRAAAEHPHPGRTETFRRLNRTEYQNAVRDLLSLEVDVSTMLPPDESSHGFDNVTVADLSPTLIERYVTAAQKISRLAVGGARRTPGGDTIRVKPDITQEEHIVGLPMGTRGGVVVPYHFPQTGEYEVSLRLMRDRNEQVEGLSEPHELLLLVDRGQVESFTVKPSTDRKDSLDVDAHLKARISVTAGLHDLGATFLKKSSSLLETRRQPFLAHFNMHRHPRLTPAIFQVSITGPYSSQGTGDTASRRRIFVSYPTKAGEEDECARQILTVLLRRAYRRPVAEDDLQQALAFYRNARKEGDFDTGIEAAVSAILVSPQFLFRIEQDATGVPPQSAYRLSDLELSSRLSFFIWSSIPDDELLDAAVRGDLRQPALLEQQVRRMLADARSHNLVTNFADQWLHLRNLESTTPDLRQFPDFDDNLRQAFRQETELFFESMLREDRSVLDLLRADYTYLNERLAKHYGIPHIYGSRFRRVTLDADDMRGGLFRHGSILTVTSYATRTSPVLRGKWILENILGSPPPPPPTDVPALKDNTIAANLSVRERLAEHRSNPACASCHQKIDPVGFSLENFDAVGRWRTVEEGKPVDASGGLPGGSEFTGVAGLERGLLERPELFVSTLAEKLLVFALGRGIEHHDAPAIRKIVADARRDNYRLSSLVVGIAASVPFQMRSTP